MKKIASVSFTHTSKRYEVSTYFKQDNALAYFLNKLDGRFFCFHNIVNNPEYCRKYALNVNESLKKVDFFLFKTPSFNLMFSSLLVMLKEKGYTDIVYIPDDSQFCTKRKNYLDNILSYYKNTKDFPFLSLTVSSAQLTKQDYAIKKLHINKNLIVSLFKTDAFKNLNILDVINKPFIANIDWLLKLCDKTYSELQTKNEGDLYLRSQFTKVKDPVVGCLNIKLVRCFYYLSDKKAIRQKELHLLRKLLQHKKHLL